MRNLIFYLSLILLFSCSNTLSPEQEAANAALECYQYLVERQPDKFLEGKVGIDSLSKAYTEQLLQATRLYLSDIDAKHGGLREVRISNNVARCDTLPTHGGTGDGLPVVYAYLILCYTDSTHEEIVVPMTEKNGQWCMK